MGLGSPPSFSSLATQLSMIWFVSSSILSWFLVLFAERASSNSASRAAFLDWTILSVSASVSVAACEGDSLRLERATLLHEEDVVAVDGKYFQRDFGVMFATL